MNALDLIDDQLQKAAAPRSTGKPIFLFLKPDEKFLIRPLFDLKDSVVLMKHNLWSEDPNKRVNAICAKEEGKECLYCQQAADNKKLTPKLHFYLPIFVYKGVNQKTQKEITYEETQEDGSKATKAVKGFRILELAAFGTIGDILKWFREFVKDEDNCKITECDFSLSQSGEGTTKTFLLMNKAPKPMSEQLVQKAAIINMENVKSRVLEARAPFISTEGTTPAGFRKSKDIDEEYYHLHGETKESTLARGKSENLRDVEKGWPMNAGKKAEEPALDDTIMDF